VSAARSACARATRIAGWHGTPLGGGRTQVAHATSAARQKRKTFASAGLACQLAPLPHPSLPPSRAT
jgi:hypothetical protein